MREIWYGDRRDIVKWAAVKEIAGRAGTADVLQVLFYRPSMLCVQTTDLKRPAIHAQIPRELYEHLRLDLRNAVQLGKELKLNVMLIDATFQRLRQEDGTLWAKEYVEEAAKRIKSASKLVIFLDPDTGIEPERPDETHVTIREANALWTSMKQGMWLLFYQHRPLGAKGDRWVAEKRCRLAEALTEPTPTEVLTLTAEDIAKDVAFFAASKP